MVRMNIGMSPHNYHKTSKNALKPAKRACFIRVNEGSREKRQLFS